MKKQIIFLFALMVASMLSANNISVTNISLTGQNTTNDYAFVKFDISWENSWRNDISGAGNAVPYNWDAAWVFVKYKVNGNYVSASSASSSGTTITVTSTTGLRVGMPVSVTSGTGDFASGTVVTVITNSTTFDVSATPTNALSGAVVTGYAIWEHAILNSTGHTSPTASTITSASDGTGIFIYRDANGTGTNTFTNTRLRWNYGTNGVADNAIVDIQVFAIEMVFVPMDVFEIGSGGTGTSEFYKYPTSSNTFTINTESAITVGTATGNLYYASSSYGGDQSGPIPSDFPKGYAAFYCMKYEISQKGYVDFLNTLTYTQQAARTVSAPSSSAGTGALHASNNARNGIDIQIPGVNSTTPAVYACNIDGDGIYNESNDGQWIACDWLSWLDVAAFLDWSGLRPLTELEFEKSCRGTVSPLADEFAWGSKSIVAATGISNAGYNYETASNSGANACYFNAGTNGPLRVGSFATGSSTRVQSGATYYGIMEMSGNQWERTVTVGNIAGRSFRGVHGDGMLNKSGEATVDYWPGINGNSTLSTVNSTYGGITGVTGAAGVGYRGGFWGIVANYLRISDRTYTEYTHTGRQNDWGGRGARTAN